MIGLLIEIQTLLMIIGDRLLSGSKTLGEVVQMRLKIGILKEVCPVVADRDTTLLIIS